MSAPLQAASPLRLPAGVTPVRPDPADLRESATERAEREAAAREHRITHWHRNVPRRFRAATAADITTEQDPHGRIAHWWTDGGSTLVLIGATGLGKTHAAYGVANDVVTSERLWVAAHFMPDLNDALRPYGEDEGKAALNECRDADVLLIDDLGREKRTEWTIERLTMILDARNRDTSKRTIITSNLSGEEMVERYGDPVTDRIIDGMWHVQLGGQPRRRPAPW